MKTINTVIIGCGNISGLNEKDLRRIKPATHIGAINNSSKFNLCGVYDLDKRKSEEFKKIFNIKNYISIKDLIQSTKAEFVVVAIPYKNNLKIFKEIFKFKSKIKFIFCEKPMSDSYDSAKKIERICKKNSVKLFINNRRLDNGIQKLKKIVDNKKLGNLNYIEGRCSSGIYALGIHLIDTIKYISGHEFKFIFKVNDKFVRQSLQYSNNYKQKDPKIIAISYHDDTYCTLINSVRSNFSFFEINLRFENGKVNYDQSKDYINYEYLSKREKKSSIDYLIDVRKKIYFKQNSIFLSNYKYLEKNIKLNKNNILGYKHALQNIKTIELLKNKI